MHPYIAEQLAKAHTHDLLVAGYRRTDRRRARRAMRRASRAAR